VSARDGSVDAEAPQPGGHSSSPSTLAQVIASIHESRDEQTELLRLLVTNSNCDGVVIGNAREQARSSYVEFLATQPPTFTEASEPPLTATFSYEGDQAEAIAAKLLSASPPLTIDGVDKMYHQPVEIHAIVAVQLADAPTGNSLT
jgi:hypothetical protein